MEKKKRNKPKNVYWDKSHDKYMIRIDGKFYGYHEDLETAIKKKDEIIQDYLQQFAK